jgi:hypothetical protein
MVVGMHRSGTSVISRSLGAFDISLGDNLMPGDGSNPKGFYEDMDTYELNEKLLGHIDQQWSTHEPLPIDAFSSMHKTFSSEASDLIQRKMSNVNTFAFKDPRTSILLPFWKRVIEALDIQIKYVFVFRNPLSVLDSLFDRDGFTGEKTLLLWLKYNLLALGSIDINNSIFVDYDTAIGNIPKHLLRLSKFLKMPINSEDKKILQYEFIDKSLRHSEHRAIEVLDDEELHPTFKDVYRTLILFSVSDRCKGPTLADIERWVEWYSKSSNGVIDSGYEQVMLS